MSAASHKRVFFNVGGRGKHKKLPFFQPPSHSRMGRARMSPSSSKLFKIWMKVIVHKRNDYMYKRAQMIDTTFIPKLHMDGAGDIQPLRGIKKKLF